MYHIKNKVNDLIASNTSYLVLRELFQRSHKYFMGNTRISIRLAFYYFFISSELLPDAFPNEKSTSLILSKPMPEPLITQDFP